ncbi:DUF2063 domain-containing protein [Rhizobium sp. S-51]|uniref:DUF2063 domain-containing protein n=1 Tax=Rhizobium terricola TaxID=2728849 RepID=A0A7Y0FYD0_9HYPH|nr:DNA-binding domain-containing protein [Rhizobium terricola]NML76830.1 DUF2063 domain-containing protein [Rhizobium terricola]
MSASTLTALQPEFAAALTDASLPVPEGLTSWTADRPPRRFAVYRNNVRSGLVAALASRFPVTERIVGADFFSAMAAEFIARHPPRSPLLLTYGDDLADFVATFEPARDLSYLPDVIRLEAARGRAYHAADMAPLEASDLTGLDPERIGDLRLVAHPSLSILRSAHPVVTIWAMNAGEMPLQPVDDWSGEDALVLRPAMIVEVHRLPSGAAVFLSGLAAGLTLAEAAETALGDTPEFDLVKNLVGLITSGAFSKIQTPEEA